MYTRSETKYVTFQQIVQTAIFNWLLPRKWESLINEKILHFVGATFDEKELPIIARDTDSIM